MIRISLIGFGNVAHHLADAFERCAETELVQVFSRSGNPNESAYSNRIVSDINQLRDADLFIIAVSDAAVESVSASLPFSGKLVVHTAGSLAMDVLNGRHRKGVFYPLQTFSRNKAVDFATVPICIESEDVRDYAILETVARALSHHVYRIDSDQRKALHVSAVFVSNFANHMYKLGSDICADHGMSFDILKPLIAETADKIRTLSPSQAQTGPAIRHDGNTIESHLKLLSNLNHRKIYEIITSSIQNERKEL